MMNEKKTKDNRKYTKKKEKTPEQIASDKAIREQFGRKLRALREERNIQQNQLSNDLGFHIQTISRYERALIDPTLSNLIALAKYFNVSIDFLADYSNNPYTAEDYLKIPYVDSDKYWIADKSFLKTLTDKTNLCAFVVKNNNLQPDLQKGDTVLISMDKAPAMDKYVLILSGSEYVIKSVESISRDGSIFLASKNDSPLKVSDDDIVGIIEACCRGI